MNAALPPRFEVTPLEDLRGRDDGRVCVSGLPGQAAITGPDGQYFGHEWSQWRYDTLDVWVDTWLAALSHEADILDLGSATGARAETFARGGHRVTAADCTDQTATIALRNARLTAEDRHRYPVTFMRADLRDPASLPCRHTFDLIHLRRVINFVTLAQVAAALDVLVPSLAPTGCLVMSFIATGISEAAEMTAPVPDGEPRGWLLFPGFHAHHFGDVVRILEQHGLTIFAAFSDSSVEAGLIARRRQLE
jgi:2-polyprenyl-3-methyl-5-hydroxy-6-metoxy-1,4-benzoquinol methylase